MVPYCGSTHNSELGVSLAEGNTTYCSSIGSCVGLWGCWGEEEERGGEGEGRGGEGRGGEGRGGGKPRITVTRVGT